MNRQNHQTRTPDQCRADARAEVSATLHRALADCDPRARATWADAIGISREYIDRCVSGDKQLHAADLLFAPGPVLVAFCKLALGAGRGVVDMPAGLDAKDDLALVIATSRETTGAVNEMLSCIADGHMTAAEGAKLEREADEAIAALLSVRERARMAQRERVLGTTGLRAVGGR